MIPLIPIYTESSKQFLVACDVIKPTEVSIKNIKLLTAPLKFDSTFDLIGISQSDTLLKEGVASVTDRIDSFIKLVVVYLRLPNGDVLKVETANFSTNTFYYLVEGNYRMMILEFHIKLNNYKETGLDIEFNINGIINLETGITNVGKINIINSNKVVQFLGYDLFANIYKNTH